MKESLPTPPASPTSGSPSAHPTGDRSLKDLRQTLDTLLERYLYLLDEQQQLQEQLGKHMSAGFFSLARANQSCAPGRRYGEDYYDERMKATRTIEISVCKSDNDRKDKTEEENDKGKENENEDEDETRRLETPLFKTISTSTAAPAQPDAPTDSPNPNSDHSESSRPPPDQKPTKTPSSSTPRQSPTNPIRWFGILVPPSLRSAQGSFTSAVDGPIPAVASVISEMRQVEERVNESRRLLAAEESRASKPNSGPQGH